MGARKPRALTSAEQLARSYAAYDRGWADSLTGLQAGSAQPIAERYDYMRGWQECSNMRWLADPINGSPSV